ncbi:MAG: aminoacyl-tRNA hydrolase [Clostridia bacterium]|nr:aminoacyl-tRNA hydrolase [Clostridia bacterium]
MFLIAGLGNPGAKYDNTRHNIGFIAINYLAAKHNINVNKIKFKGVLGEGTIAGEKVIILKPQTFMNLSGESIAEVMNFYKLKPEELIVLHDDVSLDCGRLRIRKKGSDGGHNGLKSIIYQTKSDVFNRIKIGVGAKPAEWDLADWVLGKFTDSDIKILSKTIENAADAVEEIIRRGADSAMNKFNS